MNSYKRKISEDSQYRFNRYLRNNTYKKSNASLSKKKKIIREDITA